MHGYSFQFKTLCKYPHIDFALFIFDFFSPQLLYNNLGEYLPDYLTTLTLLQKRAVRVITFSDFKAYITPLFYRLRLLKPSDLIYFKNALFMYEYNNGSLLSAFSHFFLPLSSVHQYNTRLAKNKSFYLPKIRTNYSKFNIRFHGVKVWNSIPDNLTNH